jgi:hypothetical protein
VFTTSQFSSNMEVIETCWFCWFLWDGTGGQSALALRLLLAVFSSKISSSANRPFGEEVLPNKLTCDIWHVSFLQMLCDNQATEFYYHILCFGSSGQLGGCLKILVLNLFLAIVQLK